MPPPIIGVQRERFVPALAEMRIVILGSGRGSNAEAILNAQAAGQLSGGSVVQLFADRPDAGILALGPRFRVPAAFVDPAPFRTKLEGEGEARYIDAIAQCRKALKLDPSSAYLHESLNEALDNKVQLLRAAATLPSGL